MGARLAGALADYEQAVKEKLAEVADLQGQLNSARREASGVEMGKEVERLKGEVRSTTRHLEEEREGRKRAELRAEQLRSDLGGMEALVNSGNTGEDDSMVQLGLSGAAEAAGTSNSSLRIREELHRSLVGNRTKRDEISKLEAACHRLEINLRVKEADLQKALESEKMLKVHIDNLQSELMKTGGSSDAADQVKSLQEELIQVEAQNMELKRHLGEMVASHDEDKQVAIEELREEYEEQVREGVKETQGLMEGEVRRLKVEVEVLTQTLLEVRSNLTKEGDRSAGLIVKVKDLEQQLVEKEASVEDLEKRMRAKEDQLLETEKKRVRFERESLTKGEVGQDQMASLRRDVEAEVGARMLQEVSSRENAVKESTRKEVGEEKDEEMRMRLEEEKLRFERTLEVQLEERVEQVKAELHATWQIQTKGEVEEAVSRARLEWIKRLPEAEKVGGAARESLGELERLKMIHERERNERERVEVLVREKDAELRRLKVKELDGETMVLEGKREARREVEEKLGKELREALGKQQEQWAVIVRSGREEAEEAKRQLVNQWEGQVQALEQRLKRSADERKCLEERERDLRLEVGKVRKDAAESVRERSNREVAIMKEELARKGEEVVRQREEMSALVSR